MPSRRSLVLFVSVAAHVAVLVAILVASLMATGTMPTPFNRLAFEIDRTVRLIDITLPAQLPTRRRARSAEMARFPCAEPCRRRCAD